MKKIIFMAALATLTLPALAQNYNPEEPLQTKSLSNSGIRDVYAETSGGNLLIEGVSESEARVEVFVWPGNNRDRKMTKEEVEKRLAEEYTLTITTDDHQLKVIAKRKPLANRMKNSLGVSFRMYVPAPVNSELHTSGGNIAVKELSGGKQRFTTSGGNIAVDHVTGDVKGSTSGGNIQVADSKNNIDLRTSGGSIGAKDIEGNLHAGTSGGNVALSGLSCSVEASTSGGNMDVTMAKLGEYVTLNNSGGNTVLKLPAGAAVDLQLRARRVHAEAMKSFDGNIDEKHVEGKLNGGGIPVKVDGGSGSLAVEFK
jgi:hypothetical protein